jgi:hypothetical protein
MEAMKQNGLTPITLSRISPLPVAVLFASWNGKAGTLTVPLPAAVAIDLILCLATCGVST